MATGSGSMRIWPRWAAMVRARPMLRSPWAWRPGYRVSFSTSAQLGEAREERALGAIGATTGPLCAIDSHLNASHVRR